jgi:hypothetical protein
MKRILILLSIALAGLGLTANCQNQMNDDGTKVAGYLTDNHTNDKTQKKVSWKFEFGLVFENVPAITNTTSADGSLNYSSYDAVSYPAGTTALHFWYNPSKFISLRLKPAVTYGLPISGGSSGYYFDFSGQAKLLLGGSVKVFAEAAYINRSGNYTLDLDEADASLGIATSTGLTTTGSFNYSVTRYGGGLYFETSKETDSYIELGAFRESTNLGSNGTSDNAYTRTSPMVYRATFVMGKFYLEGSYGPNYPMDGAPLYNLDNNGVVQKSFVEIKLGAIFTLH